MSTQSSERKVELVPLTYEQLPDMFQRILDQTMRYFNEHQEHPAQLKGITTEGQMISIPVHEEAAMPMVGLHLVDSKALNLARLKVEPIVMIWHGAHVLNGDENYELPSNTVMVESDGDEQMFQAVIATYHDPTGTIGAVAPVVEHDGKRALGPWCVAGLAQAEWHDGPMRNLYQRSKDYAALLSHFFGIESPE